MMDFPDGRKVRMNGNNPDIAWPWEISWMEQGQNNSPSLRESKFIPTEAFHRDSARKIRKESPLPCPLPQPPPQAQSGPCIYLYF